VLAHPLRRVVCWLNPEEFKTTWLANKAIYRTRMAIGDDGELIILAPGVSRFGEDPVIDSLIRRYGYRGTPATLEAVGHDPQLADNLGAAAHLIHGSSEGRFHIVYCTDPARGTRLGVTPGTVSGQRRDRDGEGFEYIANPALGLWATSSTFPQESVELQGESP
jgi:hypothetical protein